MRQVSEKRKTRWAAGLCLGLALILSAAGCGGSSVAATLTVTLTPATATALVGSFVQFTVVPSATIDSATFLVNDVAGGNTTVGTITTVGLYQAPTLVPANTTITVTVQAANSGNGTSASATATVTLDSGVRVSFAPTTFTIGNSDTFPLPVKVTVTGVPPNASISGVCDSLLLTSGTTCKAVTWSANNGSIDGNGTYTGPGTDGTATVTATSVYDTTRSATATITLVDPVDPTVSSISNDVGAIGATQQDIYLTGANFLSDTVVKANGKLVNNTDLVSSSVLRVRLAAADLKVASTPTTLTFTAAMQGGADQSCSTPCQLKLSAQRPAIVGTVPDSFKAGSTADIFVDGGYYGTSGSPTVSVDFGGQLASVISANQLKIPSAGSSTPGLAPITVTSNVTGASVGSAVANVAVQPVISTALVPSASPSVGTQPSSVAINTATGIAVVANQGSNSVALIDLASPASPLGFICTATQGATLSLAEPVCPASGPTSVAVDNLRNLALVTNSSSTPPNVAVIDLAAQKVREIIIPAAVNIIARTPWAVGINPVTGQAIVAYQSAGFASVIDLTQTPAVIKGLVAASTGPTPHIAVSPRLNWALVTPGGAGSLSIVDLSVSRQNKNSISSASRSSNVVTIVTSSAHTLRPGDPVLISGVADSSFNGVFNVTGVSGNTFTYSQTASNTTSGGGTANYALPIATVATSLSTIGVGINDETQKAILVDPSGTTPALIYNLLDQTSTTIPGLALTGNAAGAFNPLTNVAVTVNRINSDGAVIDPATPALIANGTLTGLPNQPPSPDQPVDVAIDPGTNQAVVVNQGNNSVSIYSLGAIRTPQVLQVSRQDNGAGAALPPEIVVNSTLTTAATANPQTLTIIGSGFVNGTSKARLDSANLVTTFVSSRILTAVVPPAMLTAGPRIYALEVVNSATASNATAFTVSQSVDVSSAGCSAPAPQSVAIDYSSRNLAIVTNPGCNNVAIIHLGGANAGTGQTVAVGKNPQGVAVYIQSTAAPAYAVVANADDNTASIVDIDGNTVAATVNTDPTPIGVAIDQGLGMAVVTASNANVIDTFTISSTPSAPTVLPVQSRPMAVAVNPVTHIAAVANTSSNSVSLVDLKQVAPTLQVAANGLPAGIAFDPISTDYLVVASLANQLLVLDPINQSTTALRMGINPTSVAYNFNSSTLVTTNGVSQTMSVMDFVSGRIRAVFSFNPSGRFAVDIHPFSNLAVIADSADNRVILRPLPR